jgi:hypothetical protein
MLSFTLTQTYNLCYNLLYWFYRSFINVKMEYNIVVAPNLETLATEVAVLFPQGWKLKGGITEHSNGFSQQLVRKTVDKLKQLQVSASAKHRRTKWIE